MNKKLWISTIACILITISFSLIWHVGLFHEELKALGVYTRIDNPRMEYGLPAMLLQSIIFTLIFPKTQWVNESYTGTLKYAWLMGLFFASGSILGSAAKIEINNLLQWFLLGFGFTLIHFTAMGLLLGFIYKNKLKTL
jgi:hypothetical protein